MGKMFNALQKLEREKTGREAQKSPDTDIPEYAVLDDKLVSFSPHLRWSLNNSEG